MTHETLAHRPAFDPAPYGAAPGPYAAAPGPAPGSADGAVQALVSAALIGVVLAVDVVTGLPAVRQHLPSGSQWLGSVVNVLPFVLLAAVVAVRGRSVVRRVTSAVVMLTAAAITVGYGHFVLPRLFRAFTQGGGDTSLLEVVQTGYHALIASLLVAAWGIARRRHPAWVVGLLTTTAGMAAFMWFQLARFLPTPGVDGGGYTVFLLTSMAVFSGIPLVGGLLGWLTDRVFEQTAPADVR